MAEALTSNQKSSFKSLNQKHYEERRRKDTLADSCKHHHSYPHHAGHYQLHGSVRKMTNENSTMWSGCSEIPNNHFFVQLIVFEYVWEPSQFSGQKRQNMCKDIKIF
jgi:hypothetical protein